MVEKRLYKFIAAFGAIFIYLFFVYTLVDFVQNNKKIIENFGYDVDDAIVVELTSPPKDKPLKSLLKNTTVTPKPVVKKTIAPIILPPKSEPKSEPLKAVEEAKEVSDEKESRDKIAKSAKDLFSTVRTDKYDKVMRERNKQDASRASRLKKQKAAQARKKAAERKKRIAREKALAEAKATMQDIEKAASASHKKRGMEDAFWSPVANRITALWQRTIQTQNGLSADVRITIDDRGRLRYKIIRLSNNRLFDKKLRIFLQNLEYESFPKYHGGNSTSKLIELEDKEDF